MKRLVNTVNLVFFQDDANGEYGVTHKETHCADNGFNAFWNGIGIFHDVFEHYFEHKHKFFTGKNAMNIGGEMAAMGHMWYYQEVLGLHSKRHLNPRSIYSPGDNMRATTESEIQEAICSGYTNFGDTLESAVPKQGDSEDGELEYQIQEMWKNVKSFRFESYSSYDTAYAEERSKEYKKSVTFRKIADLHRWGFRKAERFVPNTWQNRNTLYEFIDFWNEFCENNKAEELCRNFKGIEIKIYKDKGEISWKATLIGYYGNEDYKVKSTDYWMDHVSMPEYY